MQLKLKICLGCGRETYIFSHGLCRNCAIKTYNKPKRIKEVIQDNLILTQNNCFIKAFISQGGVMFLSGKKVSYHTLQPFNKCHILPKGRYPYFKYYYKNIFFGTLLEHDIWDMSRIGLKCRGREIVKHFKSNESLKENWIKLLSLERKLKQEYKQWIMQNKGTYKT